MVRHKPVQMTLDDQSHYTWGVLDEEKPPFWLDSYGCVTTCRTENRLRQILAIWFNFYQCGKPIIYPHDIKIAKSRLSDYRIYVNISGFNTHLQGMLYGILLAAERRRSKKRQNARIVDSSCRIVDNRTR